MQIAAFVLAATLAASPTPTDGYIANFVQHEFQIVDTYVPAEDTGPLVRIATTLEGRTEVPIQVPVTAVDCVSVSGARGSEVSGEECTYSTTFVWTDITIWHNVASAESWRPLVAAYFPANRVDLFIDIMQCESGGNTYAQNSRSSAGGLFQFLNSTWTRTGYGMYDKYDPEANIAAASAWAGLEGYATWWIDSQWECYDMVR